jgi:hypothetical protein
VNLEFLQEATRRCLAVAEDVFPARFKPDAPDFLFVAAGMLARCVTTAEACLHLSGLDRRTDLMVAVRTLYEHTVTFAWLTGSPEAEYRMQRLERHNDEQAVRIDNEMVAAGGESSIDEATRAHMAALADGLGNARLPSLADRAVAADREWSERLGITPDDPVPWSFRRNYTSLYRPASAMAHPTWAGVRMVIARSEMSVVIDTEPTGGGADALQPVPALLGLVLLISAHAFREPAPDRITEFADWLRSTWPSGT